MKYALKNYPVYVVNNEEELKKVKNGSKLEKELEELTCFVDEDGHVLALYDNYKDGLIKPVKVFNDF